MVHVITPPLGAEYAPAMLPWCWAEAPKDQLPVSTPVLSSMVSPKASGVMLTSAGIRFMRLFQKAETEAAAVLASRKYIVATPGPPGNPVIIDRSRYSVVTWHPI